MMWYVLWWRLEVRACVLQRVCQVWGLGGLGNTEIHVPTTLAKARARPEPVSADPPMPMKEGKDSRNQGPAASILSLLRAIIPIPPLCVFLLDTDPDRA